MINHTDFEHICIKACQILEDRLVINDENIIGHSGTLFEPDVYRALKVACIEIGLHGVNIELVSGKSFPDIIIDRTYGVEVKTTATGTATLCGNSIYETYNKYNIMPSNINLISGDLFNKTAITKNYFDSIVSINVTHSPRFVLDISNNIPEESVFDSIGMEANDFVLADKQKKTEIFQKYARKNHPDGGCWYISQSSMITMISSLSKDEYASLVAEGIILFPTMISSNSRTKYEDFAMWMASEKGIVSSNVRDIFSAGGRIEIDGISYPSIMKIFQKYNTQIKTLIDTIPESTLSYYWKADIHQNRLEQWIDLANLSETNEKLIRSLLLE